MLKRICIAVVGGLALVLAGASPVLAADTAGPAVAQETFIFTSKGPRLKNVAVRDTATGRTTHLLVDPPGGGCGGNASGTITGNYINGALSTVLATYQSQAICTTTAPGQSMAALVTTAELRRNSNIVQVGPTVNCVNCNVSPISENVYTCASVACAGTYWVGNVFFLSLPPGWVYPTAPASCIGVGTAPYRQLQCASVSSTVVVSPTH